MMTIVEIRDIVAYVNYKKWYFEIIGEDDSPFKDWFLQLKWTAPCNETGQDCRQHGRKWKLSPYMTVSEVVQTALSAVLTAEEHEAREKFKYREYAIFSGHLDVNLMVKLHEGMAKKDLVDVRPAPPGVVKSAAVEISNM